MPRPVFSLLPARAFGTIALGMDSRVSAEGLRVALFSGNYNYVRDGANQALNRLVARIEARGGIPRVYSAVSKTPAFVPAGTLIPVPSVPILGRREYRLALGLPRTQARDLAAFAPHVLHLAAPDWLGHAAKSWARRSGVPTVASVHTRFETYVDYYRMGFIRRGIEGVLRSFYSDLAEIYAPSESMAEVLQAGGYSNQVRIWSRGVDHALFNPAARSMEWRRSLGIADETPIILFVARLVLEKGLDVLADAGAALAARNVPHHMLVVGDGPARGWIEERLPHATYAGFLSGTDLARAYASSDMFFNPSITETFGNVTLEAMASGVCVVAAAATGSTSLVLDGTTGRLVPPGDIEGFADALAMYAHDAAARAAAGRAGHTRAIPYEWDRVNDAVIDRYVSLSCCDVAPEKQAKVRAFLP